jgi:hypothetical protein
MIPVKTVPGIREGESNERGGWHELKYDIFDTL